MSAEAERAGGESLVGRLAAGWSASSLPDGNLENAVEDARWWLHAIADEIAEKARQEGDPEGREHVLVDDFIQWLRNEAGR